MDLTLSQQTFNVGERDWLGSAHGTDRIRTVTLDVTNGFVAGTDYPQGYIPSGTVLAKNTSTNKYVKYANGGANGTGTAVGVLFTDTRVIPLGASAASATVVAPLMHHGDIVQSKLPSSSGIDATSITALASAGVKTW